MEDGAAGLTAPRRQSSPDQVVDAIIRGIMQRRYVPGQRLVEADLTRELNVSRGTIREALKRLAAESIVRITPHRGAYIRALTRTEVDELLVCLEVLTGLSARLAAENVDKGDNRSRFQAVADGLVRFEAVGEDLYRSIRQRVDFYNAMLAVGGNRELARIMPLLQIHQFRTQFHAYHSGSDMQSHFAEYAEIVEGILAGDPKRAERAMKRHIRNTGRRIQSLPDFAFAPEEGS
ncbi:GntR family transcriptional regulator [Marinibaculum pumilum]|uniref:GntR family transcriptional regulator n=1 Tax=Marinibaculum pumilum TaxID=1766165 RepID=A0ABV7L1L3_9PROT